MSFRDFISDADYRNHLIAEAERQHNVKPPANPLREQIDALTVELYDPEKGELAQRQLSQIGAPAVPALTAALHDPNLAAIETNLGHKTGPLDRILELLVDLDPEAVLAGALPLASSTSNKVRKIAAIHLASLGRSETVPALDQLLQDADGYVRSYVQIGVMRAVSSGRISDEFRQRMYESLLNQCDQNWHGTLNSAPEAVFELDPARAAVDFASPRWLSPQVYNLSTILEACNEAKIRLPEDLLRRLLEHSMPLAVGERCYPHQYVTAQGLEALTRSIGEGARPLLETALTSDQKQIQEAAGKGLALLAGIDNPLDFVLSHLNNVGMEGLTAPQRVFFHAYVFDAEVCNGGIMQFFGNSGGAHAVDTLEAMRILGHSEGYQTLETAMNLIGSQAQEPDRDLRLSAFAGRFDELQKQFDPLETAYWKTSGLLKQRMLLYAISNANHFRNEGTK